MNTRKEEIEKASVEYQMEKMPMAIGGVAIADMIYRMNINPSFIAGAEWADKHPTHYDKILEEFEKNRLEHCDNITKEQYDLERNFVNSHLKKHHRIPTILDAIEYGIEKGKKEMIEKAIKWLEEHGKDYWWDVTEQSLEDFRKAMEE